MLTHVAILNYYYSETGSDVLTRDSRTSADVVSDV